MKKYFAFIMAILVLLVSMTPCADGMSFAIENGQYSLASSSSEEEPHEDACSPFCICSCCGSCSVSNVSTSLQAFNFPDKIGHSSFNEATTLSIASTVWQPPQLV